MRISPKRDFGEAKPASSQALVGARFTPCLNNRTELNPTCQGLAFTCFHPRFSIILSKITQLWHNICIIFSSIRYLCKLKVNNKKTIIESIYKNEERKINKSGILFAFTNS
jgi:hypothetical protein